MIHRNVVVSHTSRANRSDIDRLGTAGVATVHEAIGRVGLVDSGLRPIFDGATVAGSAVTVSCPPGDNMMIHLAVEHCQPGDVLVVAVTSPSTDGMIGELLATSLRQHGAIGIVIDAGVRDVAELRRMQFPVWAQAINAQGTVKASPGSVNVPVVCGGQPIHPGDVVVADDDGVVCVPRLLAEEAATLAAERFERELTMRERLSSGELGADIYGLRDKAAAMGIGFVERADPLHDAAVASRGAHDG